MGIIIISTLNIRGTFNIRDLNFKHFKTCAFVRLNEFTLIFTPFWKVTAPVSKHFPIIKEHLAHFAGGES